MFRFVAAKTTDCWENWKSDKYLSILRYCAIL